MDEAKQWYESKTVWGGIAAGVAGILGVLGYTVDPAFKDVAGELGLAIAGLVGGALAIWGRFKATKSLVAK